MKKRIFASLIFTSIISISLGQVLLSTGKQCTASSVEGGNTANQAVDENRNTRWGSNWSGDVNPGDAWWQVDLGKEYHISSLKIWWENAYAKAYKIQVSNDPGFATFTEIARVTNGDGKEDQVITNNLIKGRYLRLQGVERATGYGYSFWELEVYGTETLNPVPVKINVPYVQYLKMNIDPADVTGKSEFIVQNTDQTIELTCYEGSPLTVNLIDFRGDFDLTFRTLKPGSTTDTLRALPLETSVYKDMVIQVELTPRPQEQVDFLLISPIDSMMITETRNPTFTWNVFPGATKYEVYLNITRDDYEWYASGNLLDRYTKVGETSTNSLTIATELVDRWTYKWYVIASTPTGLKYSDKGRFGLYIPFIEQESDGINIVNGCRDMNKNGSIEPFEDWHLTPEARLNDIMSRLTTDEKARQLFYGGNDYPSDGFAFSYGVEGGMRLTQFAASKTRMGIPIAYLGDKIHGWKTIYPTQLGLAATRDLSVVYACGNLHRVEQKAFGFTGTLAPLAEVNTKVLYPRFQEGSGENADEAAAILRALLCGMQGGPEINPHSMLVTVKHWPGQGAGGESLLQYDSVTIKYHMKPWHAAVEANAASVMPGYNTAPFLDPLKGANSSKKVIDYLRNEIKFKGFVVTDWLAANTAQSTESLGAGIDVMGGAPSVNTDIEQLVTNIGIDRINESCRRVLDTKIRLGMFENPYADPTCTYNKPDHHEIVLNAAKKSITLLKNNGVLPLKLNSGEEIVVTGPRSTWPNKDNDPNTIWQSIYYDDPLARTYTQAISERGALSGISVYQDSCTHPRVAVVVIGEKGYTHGTEWVDKNPEIPADQIAIIQKFHDRGIKVITVILTPRPYVLTPLMEISDAVMLVYRGGTGIGEATAALIFGDYEPGGRLPFQLPKSKEQLGSDNLENIVEKWELPYDIGATDAERIQIRNYIRQELTVPPIFGDPLFQYGYGIQGFGGESSGIDGIKHKKELQLYPNPFSNNFVIEMLGVSGMKQFTISDITGKTIIQKTDDAENTRFDLSAYEAGIYIITVSWKNGISTSKLIKK